MKSRKYLLTSERPINHLLEIVALEHPGIGIQIQRSLESKAYPFLVIFTYHDQEVFPSMVEKQMEAIGAKRLPPWIEWAVNTQIDIPFSTIEPVKPPLSKKKKIHKRKQFVYRFPVETLELDEELSTKLLSYKRKRPLKSSFRAYPDRGADNYFDGFPFLPKILQLELKQTTYPWRFDPDLLLPILHRLFAWYLPFEPRPRQRLMIQELIEGMTTPFHRSCDHGEGIILNAATGMGKTMISLASLLFRRGMMRSPGQVLVFVRTHSQYYPILREFGRIEHRRLQAPYSVFNGQEGIDGLGKTLILPVLPKKSLCRINELIGKTPSTCNGCPLYAKGIKFRKEYAQPANSVQVLLRLRNRLMSGEDPFRCTEKLLKEQPGCPYMTRNALLHEADLIILSQSFLQREKFDIIHQYLRTPLTELLVLVDEAHHLASAYLEERDGRHFTQDRDISHLHPATTLILQSGSFVFPTVYRGMFMDYARIIETEGTRTSLSPQVKRFQLALPRLNSSERQRKDGELYQRYADTVLKLFRHGKGHALVVAPSYAFLNQLLHAFLPFRPKYVEQPDTKMEEFNGLLNEEERQLVLVMAGGKFSEGVEWSKNGKSLVDQVIFTGIPYLPKSSDLEFHVRTSCLKRIYDNNRCRQSSPKSNMDFFSMKRDLNLVIPLIQKIDQTIGRAIRNAQDTAQVWFIDDRETDFFYSYYKPKLRYRLPRGNFSQHFSKKPFLRGQRKESDAIDLLRDL
ncbi:MAG: hypothetical protein D6732_18035 [Methanobacteriota archaeon]|nr:MAG: hypothetical protein D6732_18035 [Euryarchaeota archaeon]